MREERMTGDLDQVSFELGRNNQGLENLNDLFKQHCLDDDTRHQENVRLLEANTKAIGDLTVVVKTLADSVAFMRPVVDSVVVTRGRLAMIAAAGFGLVVAIG